MLNSPASRKHEWELNQGNLLRNATTVLAVRKKIYGNGHYSQLSEK